MRSPPFTSAGFAPNINGVAVTTGQYISLASINGGLLRDRLYLVEGTPGAGKTTLAMQFLIEGARRGEKGLYLTLAETADELRAFAASHAWELPANLEIHELLSPDHLLVRKVAALARLRAGSARLRRELETERGQRGRETALGAMMIAVLTHDLRTPLTAVTLSAEIVERRSTNESVLAAAGRAPVRPVCFERGRSDRAIGGRARRARVAHVTAGRGRRAISRDPARR